MSALWYPYAQMRGLPQPFEVTEAHGARLHLADGRTLIDALSSWWCVLHGYNHPVLNAALRAQVEDFSHVMLGGLTHAPAQTLAEALVRITPAGLNHVFFADSGSVGMEVAMKMAVQFWKNQGISSRNRFASLLRGYHGDTTGVMSIGDPEEGMHHLFKGYLPEQFFIAPPQGRTDKAGTSRALADMRQLFTNHGHEIAAFVCEPLLQGAGGFNFYPPAFLTGARELCDEFGILLIADEVATGFGRTGTLFACEQAKITPDIMVLAKGLTAGYLGLSATLATERVYTAFLGEGYDRAFMHGPTFMGNALACSVALAGIGLCENPEFLPRIAHIESILRKELLGFTAPGVVDTRVLGACGVIQTSSPEEHSGIQEFAAARGVWLRPFLDVVYTMPPSVIGDSDLRQICTVMKDWFSRPR